ncbi:MAG: sigma-70 family RNA polymerase sigma factor [Ignavibacteria bacterium]|nr:sigma-70 family RNA polymerase sigma factor [Ignavibacteria bacterium]
MTETKPSAQESSAEDAQIIREVLAGNTNAFAELERKYRRIVSFLIRKMIRNEEDVADLTQDTFVRAFAALQSFKFEFAFSGWLFKIASNRCIDHLRRKRFQMLSIDQPITTREGSERTMDPADKGPHADEILLAKERAAMLKQALETLPDKYRTVIRMRHEEDLDYNEIAQQLGHPLGTVKAHLFRARKLLYKKLLRHGTHFDEYWLDDEVSE